MRQWDISNLNGDANVQLWFLIWCTFYKWNDVTSGKKLYCYDNSFADLRLNNGNEPDGIYGYYDVWTWGGWFSVNLWN